MSGLPKKWIAAALIVVLVVVVFYAPVVPYSQTVNDPYSGTTLAAKCESSSGSATYVSLPLVPASSTTETFTNFTFTENGVSPSGQTQVYCFAQYEFLPPVVHGLGSIAYSLAGVGTAPYPDTMLVKQGNTTALVYFRNGRAVAAEALALSRFVFDPRNVVSLGCGGYFGQSCTDPGFGLSQFGQVNFTTSVNAVGHTNMTFAAVYLGGPGLDVNSTVDGITWMQPALIGACDFAHGHARNGCTVSQLLNIPAGSTRFNIEVHGFYNDTSFVYMQPFSQQVPTGGVGKSWVDEFMQDVNRARAVPLVENSTLDSFAASRFRSASSQPDIADYNFTQDVAARFGTGGSAIAEELLFPGGFAPFSYASYLQDYAPGHWSGLTQEGYSHFGYYVGQAPYYQVSADCPVQEIPGQGTNVTQYFGSRGCAVTPLPEMIWLVVILAP